MRTLEDIVKLEGLKFSSNDLKKSFYDKFIKSINYDFLKQYPELILIFKNSKKIYLNNINWEYISISQKLSEEFIKEFKDNVNWSYISKYQKLSEDFIREFKNNVNWFCISIYQKLSEDFIKEFQDYVDWEYISKYQKLSEDFIREFQYKVNWNYISCYQKLSNEFIKEFKDKLYLYYIEDSWIYKSVEFKKKKIQDTNLYECFDDYFIAYKSIQSDRYSYYNFQYQYLKGEIYECFADHSDNENSFGLSVWTEDEARDYCRQLIVKVKVRYEDVARLVHDSHKIRCTKIQILN